MLTAIQLKLTALLLSKNTKAKIYRAVILPIVIGRKAWKERRLRLYESKELRKIF